MKTRIIILTLFFAFGHFFAKAQRLDGDVGLGFQFGQPTGLTLQFYNEDGASLDLLAAWDLDDFYFLNAHALWNVHLSNRGVAHLYYGPGAFIGIRETGIDDGLFGEDNDTEVGLSGRIGINFLINKFELFAHFTPRMTLSSSSDVDFGGGVGGRFYF